MVAPIQIKAVLFDLDGTLLDTEALSDKAILKSLGESNLPKHVMEERRMDGYRIPWELKKQILGLRGSEWIPIVKSYAEKHWAVNTTSTSLDEFWKLWEEQLNSFCEEINACSGATELVKELSKVGIPMAIATSSRKVSVAKKRVRHEKMFQHIQEIVTGDDPAVKHGKPAPDIYLEAAKRLNVSPHECLVFEDALSGIRSGKRAGCFVVAVPDPRFTPEEKKIFEREADVVLNSLWEFDGKMFGSSLEQVNMNDLN